MSLGPAALQVLISHLTGIAEEMGAVLQRSAYSPNIKERADCSTALFTASGMLLVQAEHIPVHLGSMPASVAAVIDALGDTGRAGVRSGDQFVVNDPFAGGTHLNDITVVAPCVVDGKLVGWAANRAHHADVGGSAPGSIPADATEIFQEGLRLPPMRLTDEVRALLLANSRTPVERAGDLDAQVGANVLGVQRMAESAGEPFDEVIAYGERRMRAALAALPDGEWEAADVVDSTGSAPDQQRPSTIRVRLTVAGDRLRVDFDGTDPQSAGNVNAVEAVTISAVSFAVRSVVDPTLPANGGVMAPVQVHVPAGSIVGARFPAAVGAGNVEVSQRVADVVLAALAGAVPDRVPAASQGTMNNLLMGGAGWVYYETVGGGQGGRPGRATVAPAAGQSGVHTSMTNTGQVDSRSEPSAGQSGMHTGMTNTDQLDYRTGTPQPGQSGIQTGMTNTDQLDYRTGTPQPGQSGIQTGMTNTGQVDSRSEPLAGQSGMHTGMTNTRNTPIEALERHFPLRVLRYRLRRGSGGAGLAPGGEGIERDLQVLEDVTVSLITERRVSQPWGLAGGGPGAVGENWLLPQGDEDQAERLPDKCTIRMKAGDVLRMLTPGGGGWGAVS